MSKILVEVSMRKDKPSRTALKVAFNIVTLGSKGSSLNVTYTWTKERWFWTTFREYWFTGSLVK